MVKVRTAGIEDIPAILGIWAADAEPTITDDQDGLNALLAYAPEALLVAVSHDRIVGTVIVSWDGWRGGFYRLAVVPGHRRQGVARRLVVEGERRLLELGARRIAVFAVTGDPGAVPFWQSVGYQAQADRLRLVKNSDAR